MKKLLFFLATGLVATAGTAQDLPQPSPSSKVEQRVGLTDITITYSRPSVKGRTIFGDLLAYDEVWRLGANACTKITTSTAVTFQGNELAAGTYAIFAIPSEKGDWQVVFNTDTEQWGAGNYDAAKNVVTTKVKAVNNPLTETFTLAITNITNDGGMLTILWDKTRVDVPFTVPTMATAQRNIDEAIKKGEDLDKVYYRAASYYFNSLKEDRKALAAIEKGIEAKDTHHLHFLKAQILESQGDVEMAIKEAKIAHKLALEAESQGWADYIKENLDAWSKK